MLHYTAMGFKASGRLSDLKRRSDSRQVQVGDCQTLKASDSRQVDRWEMLSDLKGHNDSRQVGDCQVLRATVTVGRWETVRS